MKRIILLTALIFSFGIANAHEGHDKTPGLQPTRPGGTIKGTDHIYLELVSDKEGVKLYPMDHDKKPMPLADVKIEGKMTIPRKNKTKVLKFTAQDDHFAAKVDAKGAHRYDLDVTVTHGGKAEKLKFSVEPQ